MPVMKAERLGAQTGAVANTRVYLTPCVASLSRLGVCTPCRPKHPKSKLQLSVINQRMFGLSFEKIGFAENSNRKQKNKYLMEVASVDTLGDWSKFPFGQQRGLPLS